MLPTHVFPPYLMGGFGEGIDTVESILQPLANVAQEYFTLEANRNMPAIQTYQGASMLPTSLGSISPIILIGVGIAGYLLLKGNRKSRGKKRSRSHRR